MPQRDGYQTVRECREIRDDDRHAQVRLVCWCIVVLLGLLASTVAFAMASISTDAEQSVRINHLEQSLSGVHEKLDVILDRLPRE